MFSAVFFFFSLYLLFVEIIFNSSPVFWCTFTSKSSQMLGIYRLNNQEVIKHFLISLSLLHLLLTNKSQRKCERPKEDIILLLDATSELCLHWGKQNPQLWPPPNEGSVVVQVTRQGEGSCPEPSQPTHSGHIFPISCWAAIFLQRAAMTDSVCCVLAIWCPMAYYAIVFPKFLIHLHWKASSQSLHVNWGGAHGQSGCPC